MVTIMSVTTVATIAPKKFKMAGYKEEFMSAIFNKDSDKLNPIFKSVPNILQGNEASIERFFLYRAYALRYGSGADSSIPAFKFVTSKFPDSTNAQKSLADAWAAAGNNKKALENYRKVLKISPNSENARKQIELLEG
jgi:tetratricopeptide (TPR) repeat protein